MAATSYFQEAPLIPKDAIFALTAEYSRDESPVKVNLGQGVYRDENGLPWVLPSVQEARRRIAASNLNHEYLPILGHAEFRKIAPELALGSGSPVIAQKRFASCQALSGTGGLHLAGSLIKACSSLNPQVWIPDPTWSNHQLLYSTLGFDCRSFRYYDPWTKSIDMRSYLATLRSVKPHSIVVLHACAQNPTGCDPTKEQWMEIGRIMKERQLFPLFDAAYLGFRSGNLDEDAFAIRYFINELEMEAAVCMSFAKNMGLYGERVGCNFFVTRSPEVALNCESVMERLQRAEISNPPAYGVKIASLILTEPSLKEMWFQDLVTMSSRIRSMRQTLYDSLVENGAPGTWKHIEDQEGMFGYLGIRHDTVTKLKEKYHVYMADTSRISIAGLNPSNVEYVAEAIKQSLQLENKSSDIPIVSSVL